MYLPTKCRDRVAAEVLWIDVPVLCVILLNCLEPVLLFGREGHKFPPLTLSEPHINTLAVIHRSL